MDRYKLLFEQIINDIDQGIIYISNDMKFGHINTKAKDILGINTDKTKGHPSGTVCKGDIVMIADNCFGYDDGGLKPCDLSLININDDTIMPRDMFLGIGVYKNNDIKPVYKHLPGGHITDGICMSSTFLGYDICLSIDNTSKKLSVSVNGASYDLSFFNAACQMVIIDGLTGQVKFFQLKGYSIRNEECKDILYGRSYMAKGANIQDYDITGHDVYSVFGHGKLAERIKAAFEQGEYWADDLFYINAIMVMCSVRPVTIDGKIDGLFLKIIDFAEMESLLKLRNITIEEMEKIYTASEDSQQDIPKAMDGIIGMSHCVQKVKALAYKAAKSHSNILITGESGTGKSMLAYEIHKMCRPGKPFVEVNCGAIPTSLFESELFGYAAGAFTGALSSGKAGYFEIANNGTIFLDEVGELPKDMQVKLLQVIQSKKFYRIGSSKAITANVRIISATNRNLANDVKAKAFRQDLYYRLNVFPIEIPPLRMRKSDIYILVNNITKKICADLNIPVKRFSGGALSKLLNYDWPGNIRELENIIERSIAISNSEIIFPEYIDIPSDETPHTLRDILCNAEEAAIIDALEVAGGDKSAAIKALDISKAAFYEKLRKYNIE